MATATSTRSKPASSAASVSAVSVAEPEAVPPTVLSVSVSTEDAAKQFEQVVAAGKETLESVVQASKDAASKGVEKAASLTKDQVEAAAKAQSAAFKSYEDAVSQSKENLDALLKAGSVMTKGLQDLSKSLIGLAQNNIEEAVLLSKQLLAAKSLRDLIDLNASVGKAQLDRLMAEGQHLSDVSIKMAEDVLSPLGERITTLVDKLTKKAG